MKAYTDLEQSKKLAEILPIESADMYYMETSCNNYTIGVLQRLEKDMLLKQAEYYKMLPCWSIAALLSVLPFLLIANNQRYAFSMHKGLNKDGETYVIRYNVFNTDITLCETEYYNNPIDACFEMIIKLHEQKLL